MPQVQKDEVRDRIRSAALEVFAREGYLAATMPAIAERAGISTANIYRYYTGKGALFDAVVPREIAAAFEQILERRVRALSWLGDADGVAPPGDGEELLRFWVEHRLAVVILLEKAEGTPHEAFGARFVDRLVSLTLEQLSAADPELRISAPARLVLVTLFENTRRTIAVILEKSRSERAIREAIRVFWSYQLAGLRGLRGALTNG